jgi:transposase
MAAGYLSVCAQEIPHAKTVIDKFHVMQYVYDAVQGVRSRIQQELSNGLSKGKTKTDADKAILKELEVLRHVRYRITQSPDKWSEHGTQVMQQVFERHKDLKRAYDLSQEFKRWYSIQNCKKKCIRIEAALERWYNRVLASGLRPFDSVVKMIRKHQTEIVNYFLCGQTSAGAERLNGKINRFIASNYGIKKRDFLLYRINKYFS